MGFLGNVISGFKAAAQAGKDFNPELQDVMTKLEALHGEGKLDEVVYQAEQAYQAEHAGYTAKGTHTNAADSMADVSALKHFMAALKSHTGALDPSLQGEAQHLIGLQEQMENILGGFMKKS